MSFIYAFYHTQEVNQTAEKTLISRTELIGLTILSTAQMLKEGKGRGLLCVE